MPPQRHGRSSQRLTPAQLDCLRQLVESRLDDPPLLEEMAAALRLRPYRFARLLKQSTNLGPYGYITQRRIEHAQQLLRHSSLSLLESALTLGFCTQSHFTAVFHRQLGMTPGAYRHAWQ